MPLIDDLKIVCDRLAPLGWRDLLLKVTGNSLDIQQPTPSALRSALLAPLPGIDRTVPGFTDFASGGKHGITPFSPATSLLYHAFAATLDEHNANVKKWRRLEGAPADQGTVAPTEAAPVPAPNAPQAAVPNAPVAPQATVPNAPVAVPKPGSTVMVDGKLVPIPILKKPKK